MDTSAYKDMFISESQEHLNALNKAMLELEKNPGDVGIVDEIFRSAHTVKGMAATMGYNDISELSHSVENLLDLIRKGEREVTSETVDVLFECLDLLEAMVEAVAEDGDAVDAAGAVEKLNEIIAGGEGQVLEKVSEEVEDMPLEADLSEGEVEALKAMAEDGLIPYRIDVTVSRDCALKSVRSFMVFKNLESAGEIFKTIPDAEDIEDEKFDQIFTIFLATKKAAGDVEDLIKNITDIEKVAVEIVEPDKKSKKKKKKRSTKKGASKKKEDPSKKPVTKVPAKKKEVVKSVQSVRVNIDRLDVLLNLVGELVITKGRLAQIGATAEIDALTETVSGVDRLTTDLQEVVMKMRMVEASQVFDRFPRMVRDLARDEGKKLNLVIEGSDIELDRTVLDEIGDPLVHLLRNSIDHGIEDPGDRKKAGKPEEGTVSLIARREKDHVEIIVVDDGKGIDPKVMRQIAVKKGLMGEEEAEKLDDMEAIKLIFAPGFSAAEKVTDVSGRGVGMDVVRSKITAIGGTVDMTSEVGTGSKFILKLPLTLAIIQALLVALGDETYAIPLSSIKETLSITEGDIKTVKGQEAYVLRGSVLPLVRLHKILATPIIEEHKNIAVVIVELAGKSIGLMVDELVGQQEIVIKSLDEVLSSVKGFAGATILGDGRVVLILDIGTLI